MDCAQQNKTSLRTQMDFNASSVYTQKFFHTFIFKFFPNNIPYYINAQFFHVNSTSFIFDRTTNEFVSINICKFLYNNRSSKFKFVHFTYYHIRYTVLIPKKCSMFHVFYYENKPVLAHFYLRYNPPKDCVSFDQGHYSSVAYREETKYPSFTRIGSQSASVNIDSSFVSQSLFSSLYKTINFIGSLEERFSAISETVKSDLLSPFIASFSSFVLALYRFISNLNNFNLKTIVLDMLQMVVPLWSIWTGAPKIKQIYTTSLESQSFNFLTILKSLIGLPFDLERGLSKLYKISEEINNPILSVYNLIIDIFCAIVHLGVKCAEKHFPNSDFSINFRSFYEHISFDSTLRRSTDLLSSFLVKYARDQSIIHTTVFRNEATSLYTRFLVCSNFQKALRISSNRNLQAMWLELRGIVKSIDSFSTASRVTPAFIVLEGPPGCGKSTALGQITEYFSTISKPQRSIYTHVWKAREEGKDFYDDYMNQDIMVLDDVGQGGMGQWAKTMNFISNVKLPLDCAEADKKNTKFFTSSAVICTTNNFTGHLNVTAQDGIADINALRRRPIVFVFQAPVIVNNVRTYTVTSRFFDFLNVAPAWKDGFPTDFVAYINSRPNAVPLLNTLTGTLPEICAWISAMTLALEDFHKFSFTHTTCAFNSTSVNRFYSQGIFSFFSDNFKSKSQTSVMFSMANDSINLINDKPPEYEYPDFLDDEDTVDDYISGADPEFHFPSNLTSSSEKFYYFLKNKASSLSKDAISFIAYLFKFFSRVKTWSLKLLSSFTVLVKENPFLTAFITGFFLLLSTSVVLITNHFLNKNSSVSSIPDVHKNRLKGFSTQGLEFTVDTDQSPSNYSYWIVTKGKDGARLSNAIFSGRRALVSRHSVHGCKLLSAFKLRSDIDNGRTLLDEVPFSIVYDSPASDLAVIQLSIATNNLFKNASCIFHEPLSTSKPGLVNGSRLVCPDGVIDYNNRQVRTNEDTMAVFCDVYNKDLIFPPKSGLIHENGYKGLCGAVLYSSDNGFLGTHVAGSNSETVNRDSYKGFVVLSSDSERRNITRLMTDCGDGLDIEPIDGSAARIRYTPGSVIPKTSLKKSRLYETGAPFMESGHCKFKVIPKMVNEDGKSLLKELVAPNLSNTGHVDLKALEFGQKALEQHFVSFKTISMKEVICGNAELAPLNKDSVNGYGYKNDKTAYIDFENGTLDEDFNNYLIDLEKRLVSGDVELTEMLAYHALKDEPRPDGKKPRTFAIMPLHMTILFKKYFGSFMTHIKKNRHSNGIGIGLNPYKEWTKVFNNLTAGNKKLMDADFGRWDRSLIAAFLDHVLDSIRKFFCGTSFECRVLKALCDSLVRMFILVEDHVYLITHGLQSGCWLTALLNSLINKLISACVFFENYKFNNEKFGGQFVRKANEERLLQFNRITEYFLGDDRISGVPPELAPFYNLRTVKTFVERLGMEITDGRKQPINHDFVEPEHASFLKRTFVKNTNKNLSAKICAPLSLDTIGNLFKFCDGTKDFKVVMADRSIVFQIEKHLHGANEHLDEFENIVKQWYDDNDLTWKSLPPSRIEEILEDENGYDTMLKLNNKFFDY